MTVAELIKELEQMPQDMEIAVYGRCFFAKVENLEVKTLQFGREKAKEYLTIY